MNHLLKRIGIGMTAACLLATSAFAAQIKPSVSKIELEKKESTLSFDISLKTDESFAGAEFGIKPSSSDVTLESIAYLDDVKNEANVKTIKDGILYFGFFAAENKYAAGTYDVARLTYSYTGTAPQTISLNSSKIVTIDEANNQTIGDTSSLPFTVQITRAASGEPGGGATGGGGGGTGGGAGGGGDATLPVKPQEPAEVVPVLPVFADVHETDYFYDAVYWAVQNQITQGLTSTTFAPNTSCTRAQMVTFLWRAAGSPEPVSYAENFTDVGPSDYFYKAVLWAVEKGITQGLTQTTFAPNQTVTRQQAVTFMWREAGSPAVGLSHFTDVPTDAYFSMAVAWATQNHITNGTTAMTFAPAAPCTRGHIVSFLYRLSQTF